MSARLQAMRDAQNSSIKEVPDDSGDDDKDRHDQSKFEASDDSGGGGGEDTSSDGEEEEQEEVVVADETGDDIEDDEEDIDQDLTAVKEIAATSQSDKTLTFVCETAGDFVAEEANDLSFAKGEMLTVIGMRQDGWWEAENQDGVKGMVPSSFLKVPEKLKGLIDEIQAPQQRHEKGELWGKLRHSVSHTLKVEKALSAMGAMPIGFFHSSLSESLERDSRYTAEAFLAPKLRESGLSFRDLQWSSSTKSLKPLTTHLQRGIHLVAFRHVIPPSSDYDVTSRHVRICLHDGSKILSNIYTIRAKWDPKAPKIWTFTPKITPSGSCIEEGQFFIRSNTSSPTIGVLFQLCIQYNKISTGENGEMSCGWVFMRLLDDSGLAVPNRSHVLRIQPGIPFMSQQGSPSISGAKMGGLRLFMNRGKKPPRLVVSISMLKRKSNQLLNFLPTTLIGPVSAIPLLVMYRKILADKLLRDRTIFNNTELIQSPFLSNFPKMLDQPDVLDAFRKSWTEKVKKLKQSAQKDEDSKKIAFQKLFMETAFLILHCMTLPQFILGNLKNEQERMHEILRIMTLVKEHGPLAIAMSSGYQFHPISHDCLSLDIIGKNSAAVEE